MVHKSLMHPMRCSAVDVSSRVIEDSSRHEKLFAIHKRLCLPGSPSSGLLETHYLPTHSSSANFWCKTTPHTLDYLLQFPEVSQGGPDARGSHLHRVYKGDLDS